MDFAGQGNGPGANPNLAGDELTKIFNIANEMKAAGATEETNQNFAQIMQFLRLQAASRAAQQAPQRPAAQQAPPRTVPMPMPLAPPPASGGAQIPMVSLSGLAPAQRAVPIPPPATKKKAAGPVPVPIPVVAPVVAPASVPSPIPNPNTMKIEETPLTPVMINLLRFQMVAYSHLSKNQPVPALVLKGIMDPGSMDFDEEFRDFFGNSGAVEQPSTPASEPDKVSQVARQVFQEIEEQKREDYRRETLKKNKEADPVELKRQFPPVRVTRDSNPYLLLKKKLTRVEHAALAHKLLIPSITPTGIDVAALTEERERYIRARILNRAEELENLPVVQSASTVAVKSEHPEETDGQQVDAQERILPESPEEVKALIEYKALRLVDKQKRLREEIVQGMAKATQLAVAVDRQAYRKWKRHSTREVRGTDRIEQTQRAERQSKQKIRQHEFISSIVSHGKDLFAARRNRDARMSKLGQMVLKLHTKIEKEELARLETLSKERLRALREDDEEAYLKLVQESKNTRIVHILGQTTDFLRNLTNQVIAQKETVGELEGVPDVADAEEEDEEEAEMARNKDYYGVAHKVKELIEKQPDMLVGGELKEYQLKGLQWMVSLYNNRLNGILADEMGLGKTIQTISLLVYLHEKKKQPGPFLIIVPLSTMTNWAMELEKWAPGLKKVVFKGNPQQRRDLSYIIRNGDFNVVLTTYEYVIRERPVLSKIKWVHMIIDEGHRVKNKNSKLVQTLTQFYTTRYRLILTGTPLQNNLPELWALLNFICPKIFASVKTFDEWFNSPFGSAAGNEKLELTEEEQLLIIKRLHKVLRPFLLRRLKKDVESELPEKVETVIKCRMSALQQRLYDQIRKHGFLPMINENDKGLSGGVKGLNNTVMHLRKVCNHPWVFPEVEESVNVGHQLNLDIYRSSGKFELLDRILPKLFRSGHKVLMFFQMTIVMDIFEDYLKLRKHTWLRLDGNTSADARQDMLTRFNAPDSPYNLFILSTRAGGLGLNLQVADTVILFDSDWNPHQDLQAQDRAHRIGQKNEVRILRLITSRSIEETILQRAQFKLDMDGKVIQAGKFDNKSSAEEREAFLRALIEGADDDVDEGGEDQAEQNDEELNEVLARSEEEFALFRAMDMERPELDKQDWLAAGPITLARAKNRERLMQDEELPDVYRREHVREDIDDLFDTGRGRRAHKNVAYDDGLTEEQFLNAVESGTLAKRQQRAAVHMLKKRGLDGMSDGGEDESVSQSQMHSEAEDDASSVGTGRKRPRSAAFDSSENEEKLTKKQRKALSAHLNGRDPLEMKDLLPPRIRNKMTRIMDETLRSILDALVVGADGRQRRLADPFWTLPSRKQYPDYYRTTQRPICLETISTRVRYPFYISLEQFKADLDSLVDNACKYNQAGSDIHNDALQLRRLAHAKLDALGPSLVAAATGEEDPSDSDVGSQSKESPQLAAQQHTQLPHLKIKLQPPRPSPLGTPPTLPQLAAQPAQHLASQTVQMPAYGMQQQQFGALQQNQYGLYMDYMQQQQQQQIQQQQMQQQQQIQQMHQMQMQQQQLQQQQQYYQQQQR